MKKEEIKEEDSCTVCIKEEDVEMENTEITGNGKIKLNLFYLFALRATQSYKVMKCLF